MPTGPVPRIARVPSDRTLRGRHPMQRRWDVRFRLAGGEVDEFLTGRGAGSAACSGTGSDAGAECGGDPAASGPRRENRRTSPRCSGISVTNARAARMYHCQEETRHRSPDQEHEHVHDP
jgi:hypothetical protein